MSERITMGQYHMMILRAFHAGLSMTQLAEVFDTTLERVETVIRKSMVKPETDTAGIVA